MASGKRASMREGPLAALFRKTETDGLQDEPERPAASEPATPPPPPAEPRREERIPTPQERLRHAFSSDLPENIMAPPPPSAGEYQWSSAASDEVTQPKLRV